MNATINAQDFANDLDHPCLFWVCVGCSSGETIALLPETELGLDLTKIEGKVADGAFEATNLDEGFMHWQLGKVLRISIFDDKAEWTTQYNELLSE